MSLRAIETDRSLADRILEIVEADQVQLPPLPDLTVRLRDMLAQEEHVDGRQVAGLVRNEPAVAASLLRIANSAAFGGLRQVSDLNQAIARLGLKQVASIVTTLLLKGHFMHEASGKQELLRSLWDRAVAAAFSARRLAPKTAADPEQAYLAGLLHDCGNLLVLKAVDYLEGQGLRLQFTPSVVHELMDALHTTLGHRTLTTWKLPESICRVALLHEEAPGQREDPMLSCVRAAIVISRAVACGGRAEHEPGLMQEPAIEALGLSEVELAGLLVDLEDELLELRQLV